MTSNSLSYGSFLRWICNKSHKHGHQFLYLERIIIITFLLKLINCVNSTLFPCQVFFSFSYWHIRRNIRKKRFFIELFAEKPEKLSGIFFAVFCVGLKIYLKLIKLFGLRCPINKCNQLQRMEMPNSRCTITHRNLL